MVECDNMLFERNYQKDLNFTLWRFFAFCFKNKKSYTYFSVSLIIFLSVSAFNSKADIALKANLAYTATLTPNLSAEASVGRKNSVQIMFGLNPWKFADNTKFRNWVFNPEYRYWLSSAMKGHFVSFGLNGGQFNMGGVGLPFGIWKTLATHRYEGWFTGGGISYGYSYEMAENLNIEAVVGLGYEYLRYRKFECPSCSVYYRDMAKHYIGPNNLSLSLVFFL